MSFLAGRSAADRARRLEWASQIARNGLHIFAVSAFMPQDETHVFGKVLGTLDAREQKRRRAFVNELWRRRVIRQWMIATDEHMLALEHPSGAPLFLAGSNWPAFEAELALVT